MQSNPEISLFQGASQVQNINSPFTVIRGDQNIHYHASANSSATNDARKVAEWLTPLNFHPAQSQKLSLRAPGSGIWFLNSDGFQGWLESEPSTLWCPGIPGAGKSVIASIVINHLQQIYSNKFDTAIIFIYCNYKENVSLSDILSSLLRQLVLDYASADRVKKFLLYDEHIEKETHPSEKELLDCFLSDVGHYSKLFIAIDALDECPQDLCFRLVNLLRPLRTAHIFFTSRNLGWLNTLLDGTRRVDIYANEMDLRTFIEKECNESHCLNMYLEDNIQLKNNTIQKLIEKAQGMFLLTKLHIIMLRATLSSGKFQETLDNLPGGIDSAYDESVSRIMAEEDDNRALAIAAIVWIAQTFRPLTFRELQDALTISCPSYGLVEEGVLDSVCVGLIQIEKETGIVRLVHYTTQEYFKTRTSKLDPNFLITLTTACLTYLSSDKLKLKSVSSHNLEKILSNWPFLKYAAWYWGNHVRLLQEDIFLLDKVKKFLSNSSTCIFALEALITENNGTEERWKDFKMGKVPFEPRLPVARRAQKLLMPSSHVYPCRYASAYLQAHFGLYRSFTIEDAKLDMEAVLGSTPLYVASSQGHTDFVKVLLDFRWGFIEKKRLRINFTDIHGRTALIVAMRGGHFDIAKLLLRRSDLDVNLQDNVQQLTALMEAARNGNSDIVQLLLSKPRLNVNLQDSYQRTALIYAVQRRHRKVLEFLLSRPDLDMNLCDARRRTALIYVAEQGDFTTAKLLLSRRDLNVNIRGHEQITALILAAKEGHSDIVEILLSRPDLRVNSQGFKGRTALMLAAAKGHYNVVEFLLLRPELNVDVRDDFGFTAQDHAKINGYIEMVEVLKTKAEKTLDLGI